MTHPDTPDVTTSSQGEAEALKAVVRRNTEQVQGQGDFALFDELFADDFVDHTPQPGTTPDKAGVRVPTLATFSESPPPARPSNSKRSTLWESATEKSPTTGE